MVTQLPLEIQRLIASYLATPHLRFFALTSRHILKAVLPLLEEHQKILLHQPHLILGGKYDTPAFYPCGCNNCSQFAHEDANERDSWIVRDGLNKLPGTIQQVAIRADFTGEGWFVLTSQGLYTKGTNYFGELGLGDKNMHGYTFTLVNSLPDTIQQIIVGAYHTLALTSQGLLYACGANWAGQLGLGDKNDDHTTFTRVNNLPGTIQQVVAGHSQTFVLTSQGLYACGNNCDGELGLGDKNDYTTFTRVNNLPGTIQQIAVGFSHAMILTSEGLYACGNNCFGQLGLGEHESRNNRTTFTRVNNNNLPGTIQQIAVGNHDTRVLTSLGLYACGSNEFSEDELMLENEYGELMQANRNDCDTFTFIKNPSFKIKQRLLIHRQIELLKQKNDELLNAKLSPQTDELLHPSKRPRL